MPEPQPHTDERFFGVESLWRDLRSGRAGFGVRIVLSAAAAGVCLAALFLMLGLLENNRVRVRDEEVFTGLAFAGGAWMATLYAIWSTFPRWRRALRTGFICIGILITTIGICIFFGAFIRRPEFFIAGTIFLGAGTILTIFAATAYQASKGRKINDSLGKVQVACPECGYSLAGLDSCACPECGSRHTLDELIRLQGYEALAQAPAVSQDRTDPAREVIHQAPRPAGLLGTAQN